MPNALAQQIDRAVPEVTWLTPGARAGWSAVEAFIEDGRLKVCVCMYV
jgi:hypothetical protein